MPFTHHLLVTCCPLLYLVLLLPPHVHTDMCTCVCPLTQTHTCIVSLLCDSLLQNTSPTVGQVYFVHGCFIIIDAGNSHCNPRHWCYYFHHFTDERAGTQRGYDTCPRACALWLSEADRLMPLPCSSVLLPGRKRPVWGLPWGLQRHWVLKGHMSPYFIYFRACIFFLIFTF